MRIAFLVHDFPMLSETFILNQATGLIERGHHVDIFTNRIHDDHKIHPDVEKYGLVQHTYRLPAIPKAFIPRFVIGCWLFLRNFLRNPALFLRSLNFFRHGFSTFGLRLVYYATVLADKAPYDIVHSQFGTQSFAGVCFSQLIDPKPSLVTTFRGYDISTYVQTNGPQSYDLVFRQGDLFLANCEYFRQRAIQLGCHPEKIFVHRSGIDCNKFPFVPRHRPSDRGVRLVTTGRLVEKKGIEYAIRAVSKLLSSYPNLQYQIIGDGPLKLQLQQLINALRINHAVHLLGWKNEQEIAAILKDADLFLAPSVTAKDGNQDAPVNVLKEAMAMGLPVVSTWHGGIPELVQDGVNGFLVPERDVEALVDRLDHLLRHPEIWPELGRAGRHRVETHYNLHKLNDQLVERYWMLQLYQSSALKADRTNTGGFMTDPVMTSQMIAHEMAQNQSDVTPAVTIVVVPRERFSLAQRSLESIYEHTTIPFDLIYVDGNSPKPVQRYLQEQSQVRNFKLIRTNYYLYPNQARNIGLAEVNTKYLVFVDNDVIVSPGWLEALVACAEETQAAVVGPLMCQHEPIHDEIHFAGGESHVWVDKLGRRRLREKMYDQGRKVGQVRDRLTRHETELAEFHCVLVRTRIFEQLGQLDENMLNTKEHLDFCMSVREAGETVYFEPDCLVTYVPGPPQNWGDLHYYMLRWSNHWTLSSLQHLRQKWNLAEDGYFTSKYKKMGWRRHNTIIKPLVRRLTLGRGNDLLGRALCKFEPAFNQYLSDRHIRSQQRHQGTVAAEPVPSLPPTPSPKLTETT